jgi:hypothetical protein
LRFNIKVTKYCCPLLLPLCIIETIVNSNLYAMYFKLWIGYPCKLRHQWRLLRFYRSRLSWVTLTLLFPKQSNLYLVKVKRPERYTYLGSLGSTTTRRHTQGIFMGATTLSLKIFSIMTLNIKG